MRIVCLAVAGFSAAAVPAYPGQAPQATADPQQPPTSSAAQSSPWLLVPVVSSSPKLGTSVGGLGAYLTVFDPASRVSLFGLMYQYTTTHSQVAGAFARTSFGADHHRVVFLAGFGSIKNDYDDYLGSGQPLKTDDDLKAVAARYLYRARGSWFVGAQGNAANYQVLGATPEDELVLDTLGFEPLSSAGLGAVVMHDSRDSEDMPRSGWFLNLNNLAYREALGGTTSSDAYRVDIRGFVPHGRRHVLAFRQFNWLTDDAPVVGQATVILRGYKFGQYLAPHMSSFELEERYSFTPRWGATLFGGAASLYGAGETAAAERDLYPMLGAGVHFVVKPAEKMVLNFEYAQGVEDNRGLYLKFGYGW